MTVQPFEINIEPAVLADLRNRLRGTRSPDEIDSAGWDYGMNGSVLRSFVHTWAEEFDWPAQQIRLNQYPHLRVDLDGLGVHALHARAVDGAGLPLVLLHGWPSSFVQMLPIVPLLTTGADPFDVVVISLPSYGFSDRPRQRGMDLTRIAEIVVEVMDRLGYSRFGARGSDLGAGVLQQLALNHPDRLIALHLSGTNPYLGWIPDDLSPAEQQFVTNAQQWNQTEMAYALEHSSKPQTLAHALNDSPAGLAAWIVEKLRAWSDCNGDIERRFTKDEILTNVTIYWLTETIGSSMRMYRANAMIPPAQLARRVEVPSGFSLFPGDIVRPPRAWLERT
ncbi:MAG TPA: alpha/beta fold hydrolase, partial [Propionibacteriaceae bacterium]|nr:alpha/beta fold hydrolase [Propionibacteriaceae bacterium]